ncbi:hypothetical protein [Leptodesmis sichuanensis]|jgi:hypothetical protein|uniref:hypothetical protein n=1 Tax=Leptodesmis sichuanensis TaxID=2906798 RepID=UPI001F2C2352|nr:hypothetical protein [Leptodesmis sichuanensis]UIE39701.1 hypothetical protein KIK02_09145 [Leptodesmis sichuanensis A121]
MVVTVIAANFLLGLACLATAWGLWQIKRRIIRFTQLMQGAEQYLHRKLEPAPAAIQKGQAGTYRLRQKYHHLQMKLQQMQQVLSFLSLLQLLWRWYPGAPKVKSSKRTAFNLR